MISRMRNIVQHNLPAKILALVIAVILWGYVMNDQNPSIESTYTVQLDVVNAPEGYKITKDAASVKLRVRGPRLLFVSASESDFKAYVDLSKVEEGKHAVKVQTVLPQGFELVEAKPDMVTFTLDRIVQKTMKAEFIVTGSTAPGTTVAHIEPSVETEPESFLPQPTNSAAMQVSANTIARIFFIFLFPPIFLFSKAAVKQVQICLYRVA